MHASVRACGVHTCERVWRARECAWVRRVSARVRVRTCLYQCWVRVLYDTIWYCLICLFAEHYRYYCFVSISILWFIRDILSLCSMRRSAPSARRVRQGVFDRHASSSCSYVVVGSSVGHPSVRRRLSYQRKRRFSWRRFAVACPLLSPRVATCWPLTVCRVDLVFDPFMRRVFAPWDCGCPRSDIAGVTGGSLTYGPSLRGRPDLYGRCDALGLFESVGCWAFIEKKLWHRPLIVLIRLLIRADCCRVSLVDSVLLLPVAEPPVAETSVAGALVEDALCRSVRRRSASQGRPSPDHAERPLPSPPASSFFRLH